jgi:hypothetical protein
MKIKINGLKKALAGALALTMCLGATLTTWAGANGEPGNPAEAKITKTVTYADGLETPAATFTFTFTPKSKDGRDDNATLALIPSITPATITFTAGDTTLTKSTGDLVAGIDWAAADGAGTYVWTVVEEQSGATINPSAGESMDYSRASFDLVVKVAYDAVNNIYYVESTHTDQLTNDSGDSQTGKTGADADDADYNFIFTNIFNKAGGTNPGDTDNEALVISKTVVDGDNGRDFPFAITLDDTAAWHTPRSYVETIYNGTDVITTLNILADGGEADGPIEFTLKHGQRLVFHDVPAGTLVNVTETGTTGYTPSTTGMVTINNLAEGATLTTGNQTVAVSATNIIAFTNTYDISNIPTGVLANNLPFIALIGFGILTMVLLAVINKRKAMR